MNAETAEAGERTAALLGAALKMCGNEKRASEMDKLASRLRKRKIQVDGEEERKARRKQR